MRKPNAYTGANLPDVDPHQRLTTAQIAKEWARKRQSVRKALDAAGVPYMSEGPHCQRFYRRADLDAYIAARTVTPGKGR